MCGICGYLGSGDGILLHNMCDVLRHRGPDDWGIYVDKGVGLGNRRLSVIDVEGGHQPIHNEDESIWITYNGELYNYEGLREDLVKLGHRFYTLSDTEVIVHAYEEFGEECVNRFDGMFALAIWDGNKRCLFLARDMIGIKPLYYVQTDLGILFASEIKALLQYSGLERRVNYSALDNFLTFRFVPGPETIIRGVMKLQPGHLLLTKDRVSEVRNYWSPRTAGQQLLTEESSQKKLQRILAESVKMRLRTDVPLGAYLSGGVDSSTVVGLMSRFLEEPVKTFSVGFGVGEGIDELEYAKITAEHFGTDHHELVVGEEDAINVLPEVVWYFDEPLADPAAIPTYLMSKYAKKHVTVVLTGEGSDELFGGYMQYKILVDGEKYLKTIPRSLRSLIPRLVDFVPANLLDTYFEYSSALGTQAKNRFRVFIADIDDLRESYLNLVSIFTEEEKGELYSKEAGNESRSQAYPRILENHFPSETSHSTLQKVIITEILTELPDDLLMKVDKMTSAAAIEARVPFLSQKLVEFALGLPDGFKLRGNMRKYILRKAVTDLLPKKIAERKKHRFFVPIDRWFETSLRELAEHLLSKDVIKNRGYFNHAHIDRILRGFEDSKLYYTRQVWNLIVLEIWHRVFIDNENLDRPPRIDLWD